MVFMAGILLGAFIKCQSYTLSIHCVRCVFGPKLKVKAVYHWNIVDFIKTGKGFVIMSLPSGAATVIQFKKSFLGD